MPTYQPLETVVRAVPLGLRCVDISTQSQVWGGLRVTATPSEGAPKTIAAFLTPSGIYAFRDLPGLYDFEYGIDAPVSSPPISSPHVGKEFAIRVEDAAGRYLPWGVILTLPRAEVVTTYLFSSPTRASMPGFTIIRGGLKDSTRTLPGGTLRPAAFARIEAQYEADGPTTSYVALADWRGQFALFLPSPNPLQPAEGEIVTSPNTSGRKTLAQLSWPVTLSFFYEPERQKFIRSNERGRIEIFEGTRDGVTDVSPSATARSCVPELVSLLVQQAAEVLPEVSAAPAATLETSIEYGKDVVARTAGSADAGIRLVPPAIVSP